MSTDGTTARPAAKNILFIMADQLRWDYLSCTGHRRLETPHIDWLARQGVNFTRAYVQSPICGPSRMSFYTGRYLISHGATANDVPLKVGERTLGDYLRPLGLKTLLVGKTHMRVDAEGMGHLGLDPAGAAGQRAAECGFDVVERDDGVHPDGPKNFMLAYNAYLRANGFDGPNPWHSWANSAEPETGQANPASGWMMKHSAKPARVPEEHSETPYMTRRAMAAIEEMGDTPWCIHLSYIKPHWPYIAPAPYHNLYGPEDMAPVNRSEAERAAPHPIYRELMQRRVSQAFARDDVLRTVVPVYMGLIKQIDDQIGKLLEFLRARGQLENTIIVFTSDHGDYMGDHWLGEKDYFHEPSVRIPLLVYDPSPAADATRGSRCDQLVEAIDLVPTFVEMAGGAAQPHRMDGRSLLPLIRPKPGGHPPASWRTVAISEYDFALRPLRRVLGLDPARAIMTMAVSERYKYLLLPGLRPVLYDLQEDPMEQADLGADPGYAAVRAEMQAHLFDWAITPRQRTTESIDSIDRRTWTQVKRGVFVGFWDEDELDQELSGAVPPATD